MAHHAPAKKTWTVRTAAQIREELLRACAEQNECDDCYLGGVVRFGVDDAVRR